MIYILIGASIYLLLLVLVACGAGFTREGE